MPASGAHILVVEDDPATAKIVRYLLVGEGYAVTVATDGQGALAAIDRDSPDLILLDVNLPDLDGFALCRHIRQSRQLPIIFLSARREPPDRVYGLELGGDDYIAKPFDPVELLARVKAVLRRAKPETTTLLRHGNLEIDLAQCLVRVNGAEVELTHTEQRLLCCMAREPGRVWDRDALLNAVWGYEADPGSNVVDVTIRRLRSKIETDPGNPRYLLTVRGRGYRFGG